MLAKNPRNITLSILKATEYNSDLIDPIQCILSTLKIRYPGINVR
jgi:hypothetical protein